MKPTASGSAARSRAPFAPQRVFRNDKALIGWIFMSVWLGFLACFSYLFLRDGGIPQLGSWGLPVMGFFWVFGLGALSSVAAMARIRLTLGADGVVLRESFLFSRSEQHYRSGAITAPYVSTGKDSDGDPYHYCMVAFADGHRAAVAESGDRAEMDAVCTRLQASLQAYCRGYDGLSAGSGRGRRGSGV